MINYSRLSICVFFITIILISLFMNKKKIKVIWIILFMSISFAIFFGLRNFDIGKDTLQYIWRYETRLVRFDILFELISIVINYIFMGNKTLYLIMISFLICWFTGLAIFKIIGNRKSVIYIFYLTMMMPYFILANINILRQGLATSFALLALSFDLEGKNKIALFLFVCSGLCHKSLFLIIAVYYLVKIFKIRVKHLFCLTIVLIVFFNSQFMENILYYFSTSPFVQKIFMRDATITGTYILKYIFYFSFIIVFLLITKIFGKENNYLIQFQKFPLSCLFSAALISFGKLNSTRILIILDFVLIVWGFLVIENLDYNKIPTYFQNIFSKKNKQKLYMVLIIFVTSYCMISLFMNALTSDLKL
ncbi:MAG: EpsG family protein [Bacilli bacterium]